MIIGIQNDRFDELHALIVAADRYRYSHTRGRRSDSSAHGLQKIDGATSDQVTSVNVWIQYLLLA